MDVHDFRKQRKIICNGIIVHTANYDNVYFDNRKKKVSQLLGD